MSDDHADVTLANNYDERGAITHVTLEWDDKKLNAEITHDAFVPLVDAVNVSIRQQGALDEVLAMCEHAREEKDIYSGWVFATAIKQAIHDALGVDLDD